MISRIRAGTPSAFLEVYHWLGGFKIRPPEFADHQLVAQQRPDLSLDT